MMLWSRMRCWISGSSPISTWAMTENTNVAMIVAPVAPEERAEPAQPPDAGPGRRRPRVRRIVRVVGELSVGAVEAVVDAHGLLSVRAAGSWPLWA